MAWVEVLDAMRGCCVCGLSFYRLRYPKLLPCCHTLTCDFCFSQHSQVQCPLCQQVHSQILPEPFFEHLMQYVSSFYFDERMSDEQKEVEAGKAKKQLDEYFERIQQQHTNPSDSQEEPSVEEIANIEPVAPPLPDLSQLPATSVDDEVHDSWHCAICSQSNIPVTEYRCPNCQRVSFSVYQKVTQQSIDLPESLQLILTTEDKPTSTGIVSTTGDPPTVPDSHASSILSMAESASSRYCNACDLPSVSEPVYVCSACRLTKTPQKPGTAALQIGETLDATGEAEEGVTYVSSAPEEPLVGDFPPPADSVKREVKKPEAKPVSAAPESTAPVSSKDVPQSKPIQDHADQGSSKPRHECCGTCTVA